MSKIKTVLAASLLTLNCGGPVQALPGNASALRESHGDWNVACISHEDGTRCAMSQVQADPRTKVRVLAMELRVQPDGQAMGVLIMPFGLALGEGVILDVDGKEDRISLAYSTCLPAGCVVPIVVGPDLLAGLRAGNSLGLSAVSNADKKSLAFALSLKGFSAAFDRLLNLAGQ
jgi:invasion protein IalB